MFRPKMSPAISNAYGHMDKQSKLTIENKDPADTENGLQIGYTLDEMVARAEGFLRGIGLVKRFCTHRLHCCAWQQQCQQSASRCT